jgi:hypothetical protein
MSDSLIAARRSTVPHQGTGRPYCGRNATESEGHDILHHRGHRHHALFSADDHASSFCVAGFDCHHHHGHSWRRAFASQYCDCPGPLHPEQEMPRTRAGSDETSCVRVKLKLGCLATEHANFHSGKLGPRMIPHLQNIVGQAVSIIQDEDTDPGQ